MKMKFINNIRFKRFIAYILAAVLFAVSAAPQASETVYAEEIAEENMTGENITGIKTVKIWAVERYDKNGKLNDVYKDEISRSEVTLAGDTMLGELVSDLTERSVTYASGDYNGRIQGLNGVSNARWRCYIKDKTGNIEGFLNVRDRQIADGDIIILTTSENYKDPYDADTFPEDLSWDWADNVNNKIDLTLSEEDVNGIFEGIESKLAGGNPDFDNITEKLVFPDTFYTYNGKKYRVECSSDNPKVISDKGTVARPEDGNDAVVHVTFTIRDAYVRRYTFTVKTYSQDEIAVKKVKELLTWNYIKGGNAAQSKISNDLYLPTSIEEYEGLDITWESSNASAITVYGKVNRPANGKKDISGIKLTAYIKKGTESDSKVISSLTVLAITDNEVNLDKDIIWLRDTWSKDNHVSEGIDKAVTLPDKGENGTTIKWASDNTRIIDSDGTIYRPDVGEEPATAVLTATLTAKITTSSTPVYEQTLDIPVTVLPWTADERAAANEKLNALNSIIEAMNIPAKVNKNNQAEVTKIIVPKRAEINAAYEEAKAYGVTEQEISKLPSYKNYLSAEAGLRKLPKTVTVSILDVAKDGSSYTYSGDYFFPKTKIVIAGNDNGEASNDVASVLTGLSNKNYANLFACTVSASIIITVNGTKIGSSGDYSWRYAVNGKDIGKISGVSSAKNQTLEHGDNLVIYYTTKEGSEQFCKGDYVKGLSDSVPVEYDFANSEIIDAGALTYEQLLGENTDRFSVTDNLILPVKGKCGSKITWSSDNSAVDISTGAVTRGDCDKVVTLTAAIVSQLKEQSRSFTFIIKGAYGSKDEKTLNYAVNQLTLNGLSAVTSDITLPRRGFGDSVIIWSSSNKEVLSDSGKVTRPKEDTRVTLTAAVSVGNISNTKEFEATVLRKADTDSEKLAYDKEKLTFDAICGGNVSEDDIRTDLVLPVTGLMGSVISWSADNQAIDANGVVKRTENDMPVTLNAELTNGNAVEHVTFELILRGMNDKERSLKAAEEAIAALPDALTISINDRRKTEALVKQAKALADEAEAQGNDKQDIDNIGRLEEVCVKLDNLPVSITFSIVGADVENKKIVQYRWFVERCKLLVPAGSSIADITQAMIKGYDYIRPGSGSGYYGSILGLSQFDAGSGSGWTYGGKGDRINTSKGGKESYVDEGSVVYWKFTGDSDVLFDSEKFPMYTPYGDEHPIDKNLVPDTNIEGLKALIAKARQMSEEDYRNYGPWSGSWDNFNAALKNADKVAAAADTALGYEVSAAVDKLSAAMDGLQPVSLDKTELNSLVTDLAGLDKNDYYEVTWQEFEEAYEQARDVLYDDYSEISMVSYITECLKKAMDRLIPKSEADKSRLIKLLDECEQYRPEYYSISNWNSLISAVKKGYKALEDAAASDQKVAEACEELQLAISNLVSVSNAEVIGNRVMHTAILDWQNTLESWNIFDMQLMGHAADVNENGYLMNISAMLEGNVTAVTELEREALVLTSLGYDITDITMSDGSRVNMIERIDSMLSMETDTVNAIVWALIAIDSGDYEYKGDALRKQLIQKILALQHEDGSWSVEQEYDPDKPETENLDMTAMAVTALSTYSNEENVDIALEKAFMFMKKYNAYLSGEPSVNKGNCNATAMAMIAYASAPKYDETTLEYLKTGGLRYYITENNRLGYTNNVTENPMATEQGVRAYAAYSYLSENNNEAVNIYRCEIPVKKLVLPEADMPVIKTDLINHTTTDKSISFHVSAATSDGQEADIQVLVNNKSIYAENGLYTAELNEGINEIEITAVGVNNSVTKDYYSIIRTKEKEEQITVKFSLYGDDKHGESGHTDYRVWIAQESVTVPKGSSVRYLLEIMLNKYGMSYKTDASYVSGINDLWEFDNGSRSGWLYMVNRTSPQVGYSEYILNDGDEVQWYYTDDYNKDNGERGDAKPETPTAAPENTAVPTKEPERTATDAPTGTHAPESNHEQNQTGYSETKPSDNQGIQQKDAGLTSAVLKKGDIIKDKSSKACYKVISVTGGIKVRYLGSYVRKIKKIKIPAYIRTENGVKCTVTGIAKKAYKKLRKLKKNVIIKVPKKKYKYYKRILRKKNIKCRVVKM